MEDTMNNKDSQDSQQSIGMPDEETKMDQLLGNETKIEEGKILKVKVVGEIPDGFLVDLSQKSEGLIPKEELNSFSISQEVQVGKEIPVMIVQIRTQDGHPRVSYKQVREIDAWKSLQESFDNAKSVSGTIIRRIKGGFIVDVGVDAFLPISQANNQQNIKDIDRYVGQKYDFFITDLNRSKKNVVISRRKLLEKEREELKNKLLSNISEGQVIEGTVKSITDFGAFVDIGGIEGLLHIGDIAWHHIKNVKDMIEIGQKIQVKVLKIDKDKGKISLGMKQLTPHPWEGAEEKYPVNQIIQGKITSVMDYGIFVEVESGLEGLLHFSEISWNEKEPKLKKMFKTGQVIEAKIISIDKKKEKLSLSIKRMKPNPWEEARMKYPSGTRTKGIVTSLTPFGAFIKLAEGIEGLIHVADMSWTRKIRHPQDMVKIGQELEVVVLEVKPDNEKIVLSLKHLDIDPFEKYGAGKIVQGKVKRIVDFGAFVELEPGLEALLRLSEIAQKKPEHPSNVLTIGQTIEAKVIKSDGKERKIDISIKKFEHDKERELLNKYINKDEKPTLGEVLEEEQ